MEVANMRVASKLETLRGADVAKVKRWFIDLLGRARREVYLSTGLSASFYNDQEVKRAIEEAAGRVRVWWLLLDHYVDVGRAKGELPWLFELFDRAREGGEVFEIRRSLSPVLHWLIVDGKHIRLEKPHRPEDTFRDNLVALDVDKAIIDILLARFSKWWRAAEDVR